MLGNRKRLCEAIATIASEYKTEFIQNATELADSLDKESPGWMCKLEPCNNDDAEDVRTHILIIEDEVSIAESMKLIIECIPDVYVRTTKTAEGAMSNIFRGKKYWDIVLVDINLPGMSGLDFLEQAKHRMPETVFIIVSAYGTEENKERAAVLDVEFIDKPFNPTRLEAIVEAVKASALRPLVIPSLAALLLI